MDNLVDTGLLDATYELSEHLDHEIRNIPINYNPLSEELEGAVIRVIVDRWVSNSSLQNHPQLHLIVELSAKNLLYQYSKDLKDDRNTQITLITILLDVMAFIASQGLAETSLPHLLIEELFDVQVISWCQTFWSYLESRVSTLASNIIGTRAPGTVLIRLCNALLRRLSKSRDAVFGGKILIFLANAFPLSEKSGLNIRAEFNVENKAILEDDTESTETKNLTSEEKEQKKIYQAFWSLQSLYRDPVSIFGSDELLQQLKEKMTLVIETITNAEKSIAVQNNKLHSINSSTDQNRNEKESKEDEESTGENIINDVRLTSSKLFDLQLKDRTFRRVFLCQTLIIVEFFLSLTKERREAVEKLLPPKKTHKWSFILPEDDKKFFEKIKYKLGKHSPIDTDAPFARTLSTIIQRDENWQNWKLKQCPSFELGCLPSSEYTTAKAKLETFKQSKRPFWIKMGSTPLSKVWKKEHGLELLVTPFQPKTAAQYNDEIIKLEEKLKNDDISSDDKVKYENLISLNTWRGLRSYRTENWMEFGNFTRKTGLKGLFNPELAIAERKVARAASPTETQQASSDSNNNGNLNENEKPLPSSPPKELKSEPNQLDNSNGEYTNSADSNETPLKRKLSSGEANELKRLRPSISD